jgi:hypothetical protein
MAPEAHGAQVLPDHVFGPIIQTLNRVWGASTVSTVPLGENFIKQKW